MKKSINERIHDLRERSGLTQSDLAIQLGMTRSGVNAWRAGGRACIQLHAGCPE